MLLWTLDRTLEFTPWADPDPRSMRANCIHNSVDDLQPEPTSCLYASAVLVSPLITHVLEELVNEIPIGAVDLHAVEPCFINCILGRLRV